VIVVQKPQIMIDNSVIRLFILSLAVFLSLLSNLRPTLLTASSVPLHELLLIQIKIPVLIEINVNGFERAPLLLAPGSLMWAGMCETS